MKKILLTFVLLVGIVAGLFAQKLTYQAVIRDNNQQLVVNTDVKATVTITFTSGAPYQAEFNGSTNLHGLLSIEFGDGSLVGRDWTNATIAVKVVNSATSSIVYVNDEPRPVSAVPYALSVNGVAIQQYLTEHKYVTEMQVGNQIHDSISNVAGKAHTHDNMTVLNATTAPYTDADSTKLKGIEAGAEVNVQSDWKQTDGSKDDYIKNKPSITDTVNNILSTGGYVTADALDSRHYLTSDSTVITTMQGHITANATNITSLQSGLSAATVKEKTDSTTLAGRIDALEGAAMDCNKVKECIKDTLSKYTVTDQLCNVVNNCDLSANASLNTLLNAINAKMDSIAHLVDSLAKLPHGGGEVADGQPCPGAPTVSDGTNTYNTVKIGNQCWMAQNLRTDVGDGVYPKKNKGRDDLTPDEQVTYGRLYSWTAMMNGKASSDSVPSGVQGICPTGWHVPSDAEWTQLTTYVNSVANYKCNNDDNNIANALSSPTGWQNSLECGAGYSSTTLNKTGFSAVPAGYCNRSSFNGFGGDAYFWSATQHGNDAAWIRNLFSNNSHASSDNRGKFLGFSVRCLRDAGTGGGGTTPVPVEVSCEQVMECMGDTLGKLNTKIEAQGAEIETLNATVTTQGQKLDSLAHVVDSLAKLPHGGDTTAFTCGTSKVKDYDNNTYNTVKIGNQCWMKENLRTTTKRNNVGNIYINNPTEGYNAETYGYYYDWAAVMQNESGDTVRGICPEGWHVPSDAEWTQLTTYVNSVEDYKCNNVDNNIANALSDTTGWGSNTSSGCNAGNTGDKANATGFSAVPAGYCFGGDFFSFGDRAYFWSATQDAYNYARYRLLYSDASRVLDGGSTASGFSVRCLKDEGGSSATLPTVTTTSVTNITHNSATSGGDVTADGGANVTARGVCWSTSQNPTIADSHTADGSGTGNFVSSITSLTSNTTYYVRAYATNSKGTAYGEEVSFTTISLPTVTTDSANTITKNGATLYGNVTDMGGKTEAKAGFKYGTSESALTSVVGQEAAMTATGSYNCTLTGLTANTQYYFKAFAANGTDTVYGEVKNFKTFTCGTSTVKDVDNNEYNTVQIGTQCWMKENLRTTTKRNNVGNIYTNNTTDGYNAETYGYYYDWEAVMQNESGDKVRGICPEGWHVPSDAEWTALTDYVSSQSEYVCGSNNTNIANALSDTTGWGSNTSSGCNAGNTGDKANATGFSAVPAGRYLDGSFHYFGDCAYFLSATQNYNYALYRLLYNNAPGVLDGGSKTTGFSVRCLKD